VPKKKKKEKERKKKKTAERQSGRVRVAMGWLLSHSPGTLSLAREEVVGGASAKVGFWPPKQQLSDLISQGQCLLSPMWAVRAASSLASCVRQCCVRQCCVLSSGGFWGSRRTARASWASCPKHPAQACRPRTHFLDPALSWSLGCRTAAGDICSAELLGPGRDAAVGKTHPRGPACSHKVCPFSTCPLEGPRLSPRLQSALLGWPLAERVLDSDMICPRPGTGDRARYSDLAPRACRLQFTPGKVLASPRLHRSLSGMAQCYLSPRHCPDSWSTLI
jgi:hypothetical protein